MKCPRCSIELSWGGWILAADWPAGYYGCFSAPSADRLAPCWKCAQCGHSQLERNPECADCGKKTTTSVYWCGTSARCPDCHIARMEEE